MIEESYVSYDTAKLLQEAGFNVPCRGGYHVNRFRCEAPTQALAARWLREAHNIDVMVDVYNSDYYVCNVYKNKHLMIIRNIVTSSFEEALEEGLREAIKLIKK